MGIRHGSINSYEKAAKFLAGGKNPNSRKHANNTWIERRGENIAVRLHNTDVVTYKPDGGFMLDTGGWHTVTTKDRINGYAPGRVRVYSDKSVWYAHYGEGGWDTREKCEYADGLEFDKDGKPVNPPPSTELVTKKLDKQIKKYIDGFATLAVEKGIPVPSGGDCWGCHFKEAESYRESGMRGRSLDVVKANPMGFDHYLQHFAEDYYVPSLLYKAFAYCGYGNQPQLSVWWPFPDSSRFAKKTDIARILRRYFKAIKPHLVEHVLKCGWPVMEEAGA